MTSEYENEEFAKEQEIDENAENVDENAQNVENNADDAPAEEAPSFQWYILKVQVNRETHVQKELERRVRASASVSAKVREITVPLDKVEEYRNNKKYTRTVKKFPGYIMVNMILDDETWFLMRETPGVGDFTGSFGRRSADGSFVKPLPMTPEDVELMLNKGNEDEKAKSKVNVAYEVGDCVRVLAENMKDSEGFVRQIDEENEKVVVEIMLFNKPTPVVFNVWDVERSVNDSNASK